ncbi:MAG TPA: HRDC domain-containing protein, partial [Acidimicrobiales bacterium]|nr:HRDC domain-containing protein [Acidimicrobiales bacterium]
MARGEPAGAPTRLVEDATGLRRLVDELSGVPRYALDTEFHRERTYWPRVALVQLAWRRDGAAGTALVDPLAVDLAPLAEVVGGPATLVAHAAEQDLEVLLRACDAVPQRLFDTQVAAGFTGHGTASLAALARTFLGVDVPKGDRLTDWSARPLSVSQQAYAAADVDHLLDLADAIGADLDRRGRRAWAEEECERLRVRATRPPDPNRAWWKLRDARQLRGPARGVAQEVAAWRERRAQRTDIPVRHVLPDLAVQAISHRPPSSPQALAGTRGLDGRRLRGDVAAELLEAIARGRHLPESELVLPPGDDVPRELRPGVALA